jgi:hypothetical protein
VSVIPKLGDSGVRRSFLAQAAQVAVLVFLGLVAGIFINSRENELATLKVRQELQDTLIARNYRRSEASAAALPSINGRLCRIERALHIDPDASCPPRVQ